VWYDVDVPDFGEGGLTMSDMLVASVSGLQMPTLKPDKMMQEELRGPATANRRFTPADGIVVYAEIYDNQVDKPHDLETAVVIKNERGGDVFRSADSQSSRQLAGSKGLLRSRTPIELKDFPPGRYSVSVEAHQRQDLTVHTSRIIPIQVVDNAGR
jgi:hypothetical protein